MKYKRYPKYKDSGVEWIGEIPEGWEVKKLKFVANFDNSTVDRHVYDDEIPVSISHYPQVYNNETISLKTELPKGTCSQKEFENFRLKKDDVLITKDSETSDDIGVPVYILDDFSDAVCGYHIAQLSTDKNQLFGGFLFRFIQSSNVNGYFETEANGITRYGLGKDSISNLIIPLPPRDPIDEQEQIYDFLQKQTTQFDELIAKSKAQITLLEEKRQATINQAVTKGLDPSVPMKDSGVEWIGEIPEHWKIRRFKFVSQLTYGNSLPKENRIDGDIDVYGSNGVVGTHNISITNSSTIIVGRKGSIGEINFSKNSCYPIDTTYYIDNLVTRENIRWLYYLLQILELNKLNQDSAVPGLSREMVYQIRLPTPSTYEEETQISDFLQKQTTQFDELIAKSKTQITLLEEKRQALITATVTGKIDVRSEVVA